MKESHFIDKIIKGKNSRLEQIHDYAIDEDVNHIYLFGEESYVTALEGAEPGVEYTMANRLIRNLNYIMRRNTDPILIHMKTCGGEWFEGIAIYDMIRSCPNPVTILNYTHARSMSSLIFLAANKRVMMPHSEYMFHHGDMAYEGTVKQYLTAAEEVKKSRTQMLNIYINALKEYGPRKKWSAKRIEEWLETQMNQKEDVHFNAEEAVKIGFADEVFGANGQYDWSTLTEYTDEQLQR